MNIQIFGKSKSFDTKKAERWFKERGIKFQSIDLARYGMSRGEFDSVKRAVGSIEALIDEKAKGAAALKYLAYESDREEKLLEEPALLRAPIVRNGKQATVGNVGKGIIKRSNYTICNRLQRGSICVAAGKIGGMLGKRIRP